MHMTHEAALARRNRIQELQHGYPPLTRKAATAAADAESGYSSPAPTRAAGTVIVQGTTELAK
jgi:hypothetical protein